MNFYNSEKLGKRETMLNLTKEIKQKEGIIFSTNTLNLADLLTSAYSLLKAYEMNTELQNTITGVFEATEPTNENYFYSKTWIVDGKDEEAEYIFNEDVFNYFNEIAPDGYYFGVSEGDGACFGWYQVEDEE